MTEQSPDLLQYLLEQKVISSAQFSVAQADMAMSGLNAEDVLLARKWLDERKLSELAPWLEHLQPNSGRSQGSNSVETSYQKNLKEYRRLVARALGEI